MMMNKDIHSQLIESIAPDVYGFKMIKESILLQLFGENINILIVGDPSIAKSRILESMSRLNTKVKCIDNLHRLSDKEKDRLLNKIEKEKISILASANPKLGRFDPYAPITEQIDIPPYLLSSFDLIFVIRDLPNKAQDEAIASYILEERHKPEKTTKKEILIKHLADAKNEPRLSNEAIDEIKAVYIKLRNPPMKKSSEIMPIVITARQLQTIVKLVKAYAKIRLSDKVTKEDALNVIEILRFSLSQIGYVDEADQK